MDPETAARMRKVDEEVTMRADKGWAVEKSVVFRTSVWRLAAERHTHTTTITTAPVCVTCIIYHVLDTCNGQTRRLQEEMDALRTQIDTEKAMQVLVVR